MIRKNILQILKVFHFIIKTDIRKGIDNSTNVNNVSNENIIRKNTIPKIKTSVSIDIPQEFEKLQSKKSIKFEMETYPNVEDDANSQKFKEKMQTLGNNENVDENINNLIQKIISEDLKANSFANNDPLDVSNMSMLSNLRTIKQNATKNMNEYTSNERSIPNESFYNCIIEESICMEKELEQEKEAKELSSNIIKSPGSEKKKMFKCGTNNPTAISALFNINDKELMTDFDGIAKDLTKFEIIKNE